MLGAEDRREDFSHSLVQRGRDLVADLDAAVESAREGRVLHQRHVGGLGEFADLQRDEVGALGDDFRCVLAGLVFEGRLKSSSNRF